MFNQLLVLLEQPTPVPPITVQKPSEGGGVEIRHIPRQQPLLQFEFKKGFLITGQISEPIQLRLPIHGQIQETVSLKLPVRGRIGEPLRVNWHVRGQVQGRIQHKIILRGEITPNIGDMEQEIADMKFILDRKKRRRLEN